ncbi:MAG: hypothetical protein LBS34_02480 [Rickettsiales bacterium]|jgi:hypothetical protein|nr:hypothetical protein [Rickettsiales bacterium]
MILKGKNFDITTVYIVVLLVLLAVQFAFWVKISGLKADIEIVSAAPSENTIRAFTFGDDEFYFRTKVFKVQNMGDTYGRFTALNRYDYGKLHDWFVALEKLNEKSTYLPALAAYYFSQTQNVADRMYIVNFLERHAMLNPKDNWWWLYQAAYIAFYNMNDQDLGIKLAHKLKAEAPDTAPMWVKQMVGIFLTKKGDDCEAVRVISEIMNDLENNTVKTEEEKLKELDYMKYFIQTKIDTLKKKNINVKNCFNKK